MDLVRIARDFGTIEQLLPDGIADLRDAPYVLIGAVRHAMAILSWEELPDDERPPRTLWNDGEKLDAWFKDVRRRREEKYGTGKRSGPGPIEDPVQNDAVRLLIQGD